MMNTFFTEAPQLTCWTCPNKENNKACNDWAPNTACSASSKILFLNQ